MVDYATQLHVALQRATDSVIDEIAKDGLNSLKSVLDQYGFPKSPHLKNYEVYAHVDSGKIFFEIRIDVSALSAANKEVQKLIESARPDMISDSAKTFGMGAHGAARISGNRDARNRRQDTRRPTSDARKPVQDSRRTAADRLMGHEIASHMPRSLDVDRDGKLSVMMSRSLRDTSTGIHYPKGQFEGLLDKFMDELVGVISDRFAPVLEKVLQRYTSE